MPQAWFPIDPVPAMHLHAVDRWPSRPRSRPAWLTEANISARGRACARTVKRRRCVWILRDREGGRRSRLPCDQGASRSGQSTRMVCHHDTMHPCLHESVTLTANQASDGTSTARAEHQDARWPPEAIPPSIRAPIWAVETSTRYGLPSASVATSERPKPRAALWNAPCQWRGYLQEARRVGAERAGDLHAPLPERRRPCRTRDGTPTLQHGCATLPLRPTRSGVVAVPRARRTRAPEATGHASRTDPGLGGVDRAG